MQAQRFERNQYGVCFPDRQYHPVYLANGIDGMMINMLGSGDSWWEHNDYASMLPLQYCQGWYKTDRRTHTNTELVYGRMIPLFEFSSTALINNDIIVPKNYRQFFNPQTAVITTFYSQVDNETLEELEVEITTFLTTNHTLVEHYRFLKTPSSGAAIQFFVNAPSKPRLEIYSEPVQMDSASIESIKSQSLIKYRFAFENLKGVAYSWMDCQACEENRDQTEKGRFVSGWIRSCRMKTGQSFTRYLIAVDNLDAPDYETEAEKILNERKKSSFAVSFNKHVKEWEKYFSKSVLDIPDSSISCIYDVSRYVIKANLHPSGFLPVGIMPYLWQGVMFWDSCFSVMAMLGCGNIEEARNVLEHLAIYMTEARKKARAYNAKGARLEWTVEKEKFTDYGFMVKQIHNNAMWAHTIFSFFNYTDDRQFLKKMFPIAEELLLFVVDAFIEDKGSYMIISRCEGVDESTVIEKINDTWTCAITLKALIEYRDVSRILKTKTSIKNIDVIIEKLTAGLNMNIDKNGVMQSFQGGKLPHWGSLIFDLFPDHASVKPTIKKMMENYDREMDLYNFHGVTRYAEKMFPWTNYWVARILSLQGDETSMKILENAVKWTNYFGGIPERVFYHKELFNNWLLTAHSAMVWALNGMLANASGNTLRVLNPLKKWKNACFKNIYAGNGLVVSAEMKDCKVSNLSVKNLTKQNKQITLIIGPDKKNLSVMLKPGENNIKVQ